MGCLYQRHVGRGAGLSITLTVPETYASSTEARITGIIIDLSRRICEVQVSIGSTVSGTFIVRRVQPVYFQDDEGGNFFTQLANDVPAFKALRQTLETYLNLKGYFTGTVI